MATKKTSSTRARATTAKEKKTVVKKRPTAKRAAGKSSKMLRIRQVRSGLGSSGSMRRTLTALGLKHHQDETTVPDNPSVRGMVQKVNHLVRILAEEA